MFLPQTQDFTARVTLAQQFVFVDLLTLGYGRLDLFVSAVAVARVFEIVGGHAPDVPAAPDSDAYRLLMARWTAGKRQPLPDDLLLTEQVRDGVCFVQLHLDPQRQADPFAAAPRVKVLRGLPGGAFEGVFIRAPWIERVGLGLHRAARALVRW